MQKLNLLKAQAEMMDNKSSSNLNSDNLVPNQHMRQGSRTNVTTNDDFVQPN